MRNITLKNGKSIVVKEKDLDDLSELVREELSPELADALVEVIKDKEIEYEGYKRSLAQEMESCDDERLEALSVLEDISTFIAELVGDIGNGMTEKDRIIEELERIRSYAHRVL